MTKVIAIDVGFPTMLAGSTNGTPPAPTGARQIAIYLVASDAVTFTIATAQPASRQL